MLTLLRDLLRTNVAKLLFAVIVLAMGAWGFSGAFSGIMGDSQIRVAGRKLDATHLEQRVEQYLQRLSQDTGETLTPQEAVSEGIVRQIYEAEVNRFAHLKYAEQIGITSTDDSLIKTLQEIEGFQDPSTGQYDPQYARLAVNNAGMTINEFESDLRDDITLETLFNVVPSALVVPTSLAELEVAYMNERRKISILFVTSGVKPAPPIPTTEELRKYYYDHPQDFRHPERRLVNVLIISPADYAHKVDLDEEEVKAYYESVKHAQFAGPPKRKIFEASFPSEDLANQALGRIASGSLMTDVDGVTTSTRTVSQAAIEDTRTANQIFAQNAGKGQIFGPVEIDGAWRVMRIEEIILADPSPYPEVSDAIREELVEQQALNLYFEAVGKIDDLIGAGMNLSAIALELGAPIFSLAPVDERGQLHGETASHLVQKEGLLEEIFSLRKDYLTDWRDENGHVMIVEVVDIQPSYLPSFEDSELLTLSVVLVRNARESLDIATEEIRNRIVSGESTFQSEAAQSDAVTFFEPDEEYTRETIEKELPLHTATNVFFGEVGDIFITDGGVDGTRLMVRIDSITKPNIDQFGIDIARSSSRLREDIGNDIASAMSGSVFEKTKFRADRRAIAQYESQVMTTQ